MTSAACLTNRRRLLVEAKNTKVQYPGSISVNTEAIYSTINCNPNFSRLRYIDICKCKSVYIPPVNILSGGGAGSSFSLTYSGGGAAGGGGPIVGGGGAAGP